MMPHQTINYYIQRGQVYATTLKCSSKEERAPCLPVVLAVASTVPVTISISIAVSITSAGSRVPLVLVSSIAIGLVAVPVTLAIICVSGITTTIPLPVLVPCTLDYVLYVYVCAAGGSGVPASATETGSNGKLAPLYMYGAGDAPVLLAGGAP